MKDPRPKRSRPSAKKKAKEKSGKAASTGRIEPKQAPSYRVGQNALPALPTVWRPGQDPIEEGEALDYDPTAYDCLRALALEYPCLSCSIIRDDMGGPRSNFPHSLCFVAATQADVPTANYIAFVSVRNIPKNKHAGKAEDLSDEESDTDSDEEDDQQAPLLRMCTMSLPCTTNRIRSMPQHPGVTAVFEESGNVKVFDGTRQLEELAAAQPGMPLRTSTSRPAPLASHRHSTEGYAIDWSSAAEGRLVSGDNNSQIHVWEPSTSGTSWEVSSVYKGHTASVEDLQWSPVEETVFASCSSDRTVRIWDSRVRGKPMLTVAAHEADVNVISWNATTNFMLASGGDEGALKVWDLRTFAEGKAVADFRHHRSAVTSVEWCPHEASMLATTGADGQLCVWDLALERDPEEEMLLADASNAQVPEDLPPQLLFVHGGQTDLKEAHWHPQIPGMMLSTAAEGFNVFKPSNVG